MSRKRKPSPPPEQSHNTRASSKSVVPSVDRPKKKRKLGAATADSAKSNQESAMGGPEPSNPGEEAREPDKPISAAPGTSKASSPKPASAPAKRKRPKIVKLAPVAFLGNALPGSNPTGPWSQRGEGKNKIAVTRKLGLGAYLRRCVDLINVDGYVICSFCSRALTQ